jgi:hypothetical protein
VTSGADRGTSGQGERAAFFTAWAVLAAFVLCVDLVNALSVQRDQAGRGLEWWEPYLWEFSSGVSSLALFPLIWRLYRLAPPDADRWRRFVLFHLPGSVVFSVLHVLGFMAIRWAAYAGQGAEYRYGSFEDFLYEYRKDVLGYAVSLGVIWASRRGYRSAAERRAGAAEPVFDIRDGARLIRVRVGEILAVSSAGNYIEVHLTDGRRPLMRSTLAEAQARLEPLGLVRTHRSWLVNAARVRELAPEGSGDHRVLLEGGLEAPLSRRYPAALQRLREASA